MLAIYVYLIIVFRDICRCDIGIVRVIPDDLLFGH